MAESGRAGAGAAAEPLHKPGQEEVSFPAAVVPAAGLSRRMGREKVLLPFGRSTLLETILETLAAAGVAGVVAVLRPDLPEAADLARQSGARVVFNPHPEEEMLESIRLGLREISSDVPAVFIWPADHPAVSTSTVQMLARFADPALALIPSWRSRRSEERRVGKECRSRWGGSPHVSSSDLPPARPPPPPFPRAQFKCWPASPIRPWP